MRIHPPSFLAPRHPLATNIAISGLNKVLVPTAICAISATAMWINGKMMSAREKAVQKHEEALSLEETFVQDQPDSSRFRKVLKACQSGLKGFGPVAVDIAYTAGVLILCLGAKTAKEAICKSGKKAELEIRRWNRPYPFNLLPA